MLNLKTFEYQPRVKSKFPSVEAAKPIDDLKQRLKMLIIGQDKAGEFYRHFHFKFRRIYRTVYLKYPTKFTGSMMP